MENILYLNKIEPQKATVKRLSNNTMQILTNEPPNISGFHLITDSGSVYGKYEDYTTLYKQLDNGFILSNDGSVYIEPEPLPDPEPYIPTLNDIKESKKKEIEVQYNAAYSIGTVASFENGNSVQIPNIDNDMLIAIGTAYNSAIALLESGSFETMIPFDISNVCNSYTPLNIIQIYVAIQTLVIYNRSLKNELFSTIERCDSIDAVNALTYNVESLDDTGLISFQNSINDGQNVINEIFSKYISAGTNA